MRRLFNEATKVIEDDIRWFLLTDMYDERADIHARLAEKMRRVSGTS
jgi:hypothetical protein